MTKKYHTIVIGGGCLGIATAVSLQRQLRARPETSSARVCVLEKGVVGAGLTARHSGIVRAANAVVEAAKMAQTAINQWKNLEALWGVKIPYEASGAVWISRDEERGTNSNWDQLATQLSSIGVSFEKLSTAQARQLCPPMVKLNDREIFYYEEGAIQFDPTAVRAGLYKALKVNGVDFFEKTPVLGFEKNEQGRVKTVVTGQGPLSCDYAVNAAGAWSPSIFGSLGISIPVSAELVNVVNWMTSDRDIQGQFPIIADYVNMAYFRLWRDGEIHMHQPRRRSIRQTARVFAENPLNVTGADFIIDPSNQGLGYSQIRVYEELARKRLSNIDSSVYSSGYRSYFDITPDLKFILGPDGQIGNLFHCLGAGQAFKYAPMFGELIANLICNNMPLTENMREFQISRFNEPYMTEFWKRVEGADNFLEAEAAASL